MKIVLIIPPSPWLISDRDIPMLGVLYLTSFLKKHNKEVVVCDLSGLEEENWYIPVGDMYGITGVTPQFVYMKKIIGILKERDMSRPVIAGGVHATVCPDHILNNTLADACVVGEGEDALLRIVNGEKWGTIPGIKTRAFYNGRSNILTDLDVCYPDREAIDYYSYLVPRTFGYMADVKREGSIITGRGCPFNCSFCGSNFLYGGRVRFNSPLHVIRELTYLYDRFNVQMVNFLDDTFILDKKRVSDICDLISQRIPFLKWFCLTRVDRTDETLLVKMKKAGCMSLAIGFESGSDRILGLVNKKATVEQASACVKAVSKIGLMINGQLMVGFPTETDADVEMTAKFIRNHPEIDTFGLHVFQPFPGCDIWNNPDKYEVSINKDTDFSDYHTIGKHDGSYHKDPVINDRYLYLKSVIGDRSRELRGE